MKYQATYSFNVRRYIKREIEAESHEQAERIAKAEAWGDIDAEVTRLSNTDEFADSADYDPYIMLDLLDAEGMIADELVSEELPEPTDAEVDAQIAAREAQEA